MTEAPEILLSVKDVKLSFGDLNVLDGISFDVIDRVRPGVITGQIVGLLGPSGVGKTCLLRIISALSPPDAGTVINKHGKAIRAGEVGAVFQNYPMVRHRTVLSNLIMAGTACGLPRSEAKAKSVELLKRFGIADRSGAYPSQLSGGQRQRAAVAQQLVANKPLLILDEPFSGLDPKALLEVMDLLREVAHLDEHNTIIVITHDIRAALAISDTLYMLGRDRDAEGNVVSGAKIQRTYDLEEMGLAWRTDVEYTKEFILLEREVKEQFVHL